MFRSVILSRLAKRSFENAAERINTIAGIQSIIRQSLTEFDEGAKEYRVFRETHDTPDWGVVRMSSIAMANRRFEEAEFFLKEQMEEYGGENKRQARNVDVTDEQICASIERVLKKDESADTAFHFFEFLKNYKFCTTRDVFVRVLIEFVVKKQGWKAGIDRLDELMKKNKRSKSMRFSVLAILENAWHSDEFETASMLISKMEAVKLSTLESLKLFICLNELPRIEVADYCKRNGISLSHENISFHIEIAGKLKYPMPLLKLLEIDQFVPLPKSSFYPIFDELVKLAGKSGSAENLESIMWKVKSNRDLTDSDKSVLYGKIRHFYKCLNVNAPEKLYFLMRPKDRSC